MVVCSCQGYFEKVFQTYKHVDKRQSTHPYLRLPLPTRWLAQICSQQAIAEIIQLGDRLIEVWKHERHAAGKIAPFDRLKHVELGALPGNLEENEARC